MYLLTAAATFLSGTPPCGNAQLARLKSAIHVLCLLVFSRSALGTLACSPTGINYFRPGAILMVLYPYHSAPSDSVSPTAKTDFSR